MSIFREGYFGILPSELRKELFGYYWNWANKLITVNAEYQNVLIREEAEYIAEQKSKPVRYKPLTTDDLIYFDILIFPCTTNIKLYFPFSVYLVVLQTFLETYINNYQFTFLTVDKLLPIIAKVKKKNYDIQYTITTDKDHATRLKLFNNLESVCIYLQEIREEIGEVLGIYYTSTENDQPLYKLGHLQSEVLIYKLVKFYNDLVTVTETTVNLKDEY